MAIIVSGGSSENLRIAPRRRKAVSEILGTLLMVTITLIAGAAVFGWIEGQAGNSEGAYGQSVANNVNYLRESFTIVATNFTCSSGPCAGPYDTLGIYIYNNGQVYLNLSSIMISYPAGPHPSWSIRFYPASYSQSGCTIPGITAPGQPLANLTLGSYAATVPGCLSSDYMVVGHSYQVEVIGLFGSKVITDIQALG